MKPWTREDTQFWVAQLENRVEDLEYHIHLAVDWCENNDIEHPKILATCLIVTTLWVARMRNEYISQREIYELIGIEDWYLAPEEEMTLNDQYLDLDLDELLSLTVSKFE